MKVYVNSYDKIASIDLDQVVALSVKADGGNKDNTAVAVVETSKNKYKLIMCKAGETNYSDYCDEVYCKPVVHTRTIIAMEVTKDFDKTPYVYTSLTKTKKEILEQRKRWTERFAEMAEEDDDDYDEEDDENDEDDYDDDNDEDYDDEDNDEDDDY